MTNIETKAPVLGRRPLQILGGKRRERSATRTIACRSKAILERRGNEKCGGPYAISRKKEKKMVSTAGTGYSQGVKSEKRRRGNSIRQRPDR